MKIKFAFHIIFFRISVVEHQIIVPTLSKSMIDDFVLECQGCGLAILIQ